MRVVALFLLCLLSETARGSQSMRPKPMRGLFRYDKLLRLRPGIGDATLPHRMGNGS